MGFHFVIRSNGYLMITNKNTHLEKKLSHSKLIRIVFRLVYTLYDYDWYGKS